MARYLSAAYIIVTILMWFDLRGEIGKAQRQVSPTDGWRAAVSLRLDRIEELVGALAADREAQSGGR